MKLKTIVNVVMLGLIPSVSIAQKLLPGQQAPEFKTTDIYGKTIASEAFSQQKTMLAFMRYAGCPVCNFRMHELAEHFDSLKKSGVIVIAVFESTRETLRAYLDESNSPITIIADPERKLYKLYHVRTSLWKTLGSAFNNMTYRNRKQGKALQASRHKRDGNITGIPADFIIMPGGKLKVAYYGKNIADHYPVEKIFETINQ